MEKAIKVLHTEWSEGWGGQEIRIINEMLSIRELGVDVYLACRKHSLIKEKALKENIQVFTLPFRGNADLKTLFQLRKIIQHHQINIVNTHSGKDTWVGGLAAKTSKAKFIRTRHLSNPIRPNRTNFINELADFIFTTGESVRESMVKNNRIKASKIISVPTGIDTNLFNPKKYNSRECRDLFGIANDQIVISIIAVLRQFKRHDLFIEMAAELIKRFPNKSFIFLIAGDGPMKDKLVKQAEELKINNRIRFLGYVEKVPELLAATDIFVLSSDSKEGVPQSVMQALFMKKHTVATNVGSTSDLLNGENFILVKPNSVQEIIDGVIAQLDKPPVNESESLISDKFGKYAMAEKILEIYKKLLF